MPQRSNSNRSRNSGRSSDEPLMSHWLDAVKDRPVAAAAAAAGAAAAGLFLWSRRTQISNQLSQLSDQISEWTDEIRSSSGNGRELALTGGPNESSAIEASRATGRIRSSGSRSRSTGSGSSAASRSGVQAVQTTGGRSQGENSTF